LRDTPAVLTGGQAAGLPTSFSFFFFLVKKKDTFKQEFAVLLPKNKCGCLVCKQLFLLSIFQTSPKIFVKFDYMIDNGCFFMYKDCIRA